MTLLLGPPGSGKTTLLLALAGKLDSDLKVKILSFAFTIYSLKGSFCNLLRVEAVINFLTRKLIGFLLVKTSDFREGDLQWPYNG